MNLWESHFSILFCDLLNLLSVKLVPRKLFLRLPYVAVAVVSSSWSHLVFEAPKKRKLPAKRARWGEVELNLGLSENRVYSQL